MRELAFLNKNLRIELIDEVGLDVGDKVGHILSDAFGERMKPPGTFEKLLELKRLGKKTGAGFYTYSGKDRSEKTLEANIYDILGIKPEANKVTAQEIVDRCVLCMVNEAARCLEEKVVEGPADVDLGMIMGTGFPPFRGGLLRYADARGLQNIVQTLEALKDKYAPQQAELQTMNTNIVNEQNQMQAIASKATSFDKLPKADQTKLKNLEMQYQKDQGAFQQKYGVFQQGLQKSQELALSLLMTKTNAILKDLSDKKGYDLVLTSNQLVFAKAKYDLTDQVMDKLNAIDTSDIIKQINNPTPAAAPAAPAAAK